MHSTRVAILFSILLLLASCSGESDAEREGLKGPVYKVVEYQGEIDESEDVSIERSLTQSVRVFDEDGLISESYILDSEGEKISEFEIKRENGKIIEQTILDKYGEVTSRMKYEYPEPGKEEFKSYNADDELEQSATFFFEDGLLIKSKGKYKFGNEEYTRYTYTYDYDEDDRMIEVKSRVQGEGKTRYVYDYDDEDEYGNWTEREMTQKSGGRVLFSSQSIREIEYY